MLYNMYMLVSPGKSPGRLRLLEQNSFFQNISKTVAFMKIVTTEKLQKIKKYIFLVLSIFVVPSTIFELLVFLVVFSKQLNNGCSQNFFYRSKVVGNNKIHIFCSIHFWRNYHRFRVIDISYGIDPSADSGSNPGGEFLFLIFFKIYFNLLRRNIRCTVFLIDSKFVLQCFSYRFRVIGVLLLDKSVVETCRLFYSTK